MACKSGKYLSIFGAANHTLCQPCAVGNFSSSVGASVCEFCPSGTWGRDFGMTKCTLCESGKWTRHRGAIRQDMCAYCSQECGAGALVVVEFRIENLDVDRLDTEQTASLKDAYVADIRSALASPESKINITFGPDMMVNIVLSVPTGSFVNNLVTVLGTHSFIEKILNSTSTTPGSSVAITGRLRITGMVVQPAAFTTTSTTTSTRAITTSAHKSVTDLPSTTNEDLTTFTFSDVVGSTSAKHEQLSAAYGFVSGWVFISCSLLATFRR